MSSNVLRRQETFAKALSGYYQNADQKNNSQFQSERTVFLHDIPMTTTLNDIHAFLNKIGPFYDITLITDPSTLSKPSKSYQVEFKDFLDAKTALSLLNPTISSSLVRFLPSTTPEQRANMFKAAKETFAKEMRSITFTGFPFSTIPSDQLVYFLKTFGDPEEYTIIPYSTTEALIYVQYPSFLNVSTICQLFAQQQSKPALPPPPPPPHPSSSPPPSLNAVPPPPPPPLSSQSTSTDPSASQNSTTQPAPLTMFGNIIKAYPGFYKPQILYTRADLFPIVKTIWIRGSSSIRFFIDSFHEDFDLIAENLHHAFLPSSLHRAIRLEEQLQLSIAGNPNGLDCLVLSNINVLANAANINDSSFSSSQSSQTSSIPPPPVSKMGESTSATNNANLASDSTNPSPNTTRTDQSTPPSEPPQHLSPAELSDFLQDILQEGFKYGRIIASAMHSDGKVYIRYATAQSAGIAAVLFKNRYFNGNVISATLISKEAFKKQNPTLQQ